MASHTITFYTLNIKSLPSCYFEWNETPFHPIPLTAVALGSLSVLILNVEVGDVPGKALLVLCWIRSQVSGDSFTVSTIYNAPEFLLLLFLLLLFFSFFFFCKGGTFISLIRWSKRGHYVIVVTCGSLGCLAFTFSHRFKWCRTATWNQTQIQAFFST